ncbi:fungal-specific transcription factor domain-containing protein [Lipomyces starkeyi]
MTPPPVHFRKRKSRGRGLRVRTGCVICRQRHLKCDELRPSCGQCSRGGRICTYSSASVTPHMEISVAPIPSDQSSYGSVILPTTTTLKSSSSHEVDALLPDMSQSESASPSNASDTNYQMADSATVNAELSSISALLSPRTATSPEDNITTNVPSSDTTSACKVIDYSQANPERVSSMILSDTTEFWSSDLASIKWLDLLAADAAEADENFSLVLFDNDGPGAMSAAQISHEEASLEIEASDTRCILPITPQDTSIIETGDSMTDHESQPPFELRESEVDLFNHFVLHLSRWIDIFDPGYHFGQDIPRLALRNASLLRSILALSARHLSLQNKQSAKIYGAAAVNYYYETLRYLQAALKKNETYTGSDELLATTLVVSTYEMLGGSHSGWERHLQRVFWIQQSLNINGTSGGIRQAVWWAWLRQDIWAAFREQRRVLSSWKPLNSCSELDACGLANRVVYILAQAVNFSSVADAAGKLLERLEKTNVLFSMLEEWSSSLGSEFQPIPVFPNMNQSKNFAFAPIYFRTALSGVALQLFHFARILVIVHRPVSFTGDPVREQLQTKRMQRLLQESISEICGIANGQDDNDSACALMSLQCLYGAALCIVEKLEQQEVLALIEKRQGITKWPAYSLANELRKDWDSKEAERL